MGIMAWAFLVRSDEDALVKQYANGTWRTAGGAPKPQKAVMPRIEKMLAGMQPGEFGPGAQEHAAGITEERVKGGEMEAPAGDEPWAAGRFTPVFEPDAARRGSSHLRKR